MGLAVIVLVVIAWLGTLVAVARDPRIPVENRRTVLVGLVLVPVLAVGYWPWRWLKGT
jgi:hypothetical protein